MTESVGTVPLDRDAARHDVAVIDGWRAEVHRAQAALLDEGDVTTDAVFADRVLGFNAQMLQDLEWAAGYTEGRRDAEAIAAGAEVQGPGATPDPKDGWLTGGTRRAAYELGLADGR